MALTTRPRGNDPIFSPAIAQLMVTALANKEDWLLQEKVLPQFAGGTVSINGQTFRDLPSNGRILMEQLDFGQAGIKTKVAPGEATPLLRGTGFDEIVYTMDERVLGIPVTDSDLRAFKTNAGVDVMQLRMANVVRTMTVEREREVATLYSTGANWTAPLALAGATCWAGIGATGNPLADLAAQKEALRPFCVPNTIIMGAATAWALQNNAQFLALLATDTDRGLITRDGIEARLKSLLGVQAVFFADSARNTSLDPDTPAITDIWGDMLWMGYIPLANGVAGELGNFRSGDSAYAVEGSATYCVDDGGWMYDEFRDEDRRTSYPRIIRRDAFGVMRPQLGTVITNTVV